MTDHSKDKYYSTKKVDRGYKARIYHWDTTGNREIDYWLSETVYSRKEEAEDAAIEYADDSGLEVEMG